MYSVDNLNITLTRGDSAALELTFTGEDAPAAGDLVALALKPNPRVPEAKWEKTAEPDEEHKVLFRFLPEDTQDLPFGTYWWDVRIFYSDGAVVTPVAPHRFNVVEVVTNDRV